MAEAYPSSYYDWYQSYTNGQTTQPYTEWQAAQSPTTLNMDASTYPTYEYTPYQAPNTDSYVYGSYAPGSPGVTGDRKDTSRPKLPADTTTTTTAPRTTTSTVGPITTDQSSDPLFSSWYQAYANGQTTLGFDQWKAAGGGTAPTGGTSSSGYIAPPVGSFQQTQMPGFANPITVPTLQTLVNNDVYSVTGIRPPGFNDLMAQVTGQQPGSYDPRLGILGDVQLYRSLYPNTPEALNPDLMSQATAQLFGTQSAPLSLQNLYAHPASAQPSGGSLSGFTSIPTGSNTFSSPGALPTGYEQQVDPMSLFTGNVGGAGTTSTTPTTGTPTGTSQTSGTSAYDQFVQWLNGLSQSQVVQNPLGFTEWQQGVISPQQVAAILALLSQQSNQANYNPLWLMGLK